MQTAEKKQADWAVLWQEERQTLSLQGEPVLEYALVRPQIRDGGRGGRRLDRYYQHLAEVWRRRWSRALYWHACLDLARCREQSRPFHPWQAHLEGRVLFQDQDSLSIRLDAEEVHGDGRPLRVRMGDVWSLPEGVPLPAGACFPGDRRQRGSWPSPSRWSGSRGLTLTPPRPKSLRRPADAGGASASVASEWIYIWSSSTSSCDSP